METIETFVLEHLLDSFVRPVFQLQQASVSQVFTRSTNDDWPPSLIFVDVAAGSTSSVTQAVEASKE